MSLSFGSDPKERAQRREAKSRARPVQGQDLLFFYWNHFEDFQNSLDIDTTVVHYAITTVVQYAEDSMDKKPTIQELERLLNTEEDTPIQILPNGEIRAVGQASGSDLAGKKPLTMRENLGGEY